VAPGDLNFLCTSLSAPERARQKSDRSHPKKSKRGWFWNGIGLGEGYTRNCEMVFTGDAVFLGFDARKRDLFTGIGSGNFKEVKVDPKRNVACRPDERTIST